VFGLLKRDGNVFVSIAPNCSREELMPIIQGKILEGSTIHTDGRPTMDLFSIGTTIIEFFTVKTSSRGERVTLMELRRSGASPREDWPNSMD
jgi:transposase-like protein